MTGRRRVVVTGMGVVTPVGNDVPTFWNSLLAGRSGVSFITEFPTDKLRSDIAARVSGFDPQRFFSRKQAEIYGTVTHFSMGAMVEAMAMAGFADATGSGDADDDDAAAPALSGVDPSRSGCLMSTGMGAVDIFEREVAKSASRGPRAVSPFFIPGVMPNNATALGTMRWGLMGPSYSLASACATGAHSIATAAMMIQADDVDLMIAGGAEAATRANCVAGFGNARALARSFEGDPTRASRPYDKKRSGFVMGEGAGALVLEEEQHALGRGATPLAYVAGWGMTSDATHVTRPHPEGLGLALAVQGALRRAGIGIEDVGYLNPHATSTPQGDVAEYQAMLRVFGPRLREVPVSATKSMIGHLLGGAAAAESIAAICSLRDQLLHPSVNIDELDPVFDLDLVQGAARPAALDFALKSSAGFGGHNCVLVFQKYLPKQATTWRARRRALSSAESELLFERVYRVFRLLEAAPLLLVVGLDRGHLVSSSKRRDHLGGHVGRLRRGWSAWPVERCLAERALGERVLERSTTGRATRDGDHLAMVPDSRERGSGGRRREDDPRWPHRSREACFVGISGLARRCSSVAAQPPTATTKRAQPPL